MLVVRIILILGSICTAAPVAVWIAGCHRSLRVEVTADWEALRRELLRSVITERTESDVKVVDLDGAEVRAAVEIGGSPTVGLVGAHCEGAARPSPPQGDSTTQSKKEYVAGEEWIQHEGQLYVDVPIEVPQQQGTPGGTTVRQVRLGPNMDPSALAGAFCARYSVSNCTYIRQKLQGFRTAALRSTPRGPAKGLKRASPEEDRVRGSELARQHYRADVGVVMTRSEEKRRARDNELRGITVQPTVRMKGGALSIGNHAELVSPREFPLLPSTDPFSRGRFTSCAVVGSSGRLRNASYGTEIDEHEAVFRMNDAPTVGYGAAVGRRTTYRVVNKLVFFERGKPKGVYQQQLHKLENETTFVVNDNWEEFLTMRRDVGPRVVPLQHAFTEYSDSWLATSDPPCVSTTGFRTTMIALKACRQVTLYGLGSAADGSWVFSHYRDPPSRDAVQCADPDHNFPYEWKLFAQLEAIGFLRIRQ